MKRSSKLFAACTAALCCALAGRTAANPTGPVVVSGHASFQASGKTLAVSNAPGTIINWQGFSIAKDEWTRFLQVSPVSAVLNRVVGGTPSEILGRMSSNGRVFLINSNGIAFGPAAQIDVGGLVASTLNLSDADFLAGRHRFSGSGAEGKLTNHGNIVTPTGGNVYLVAPQVESAGVIRAPSGEVVLAAGSTVQLIDTAFPSIRVEVSAPGDQALSLGNLAAAGGGKVFAFLVRQGGIVSASAATAAGGKVVLKSAGETQLAPGSRTEATGTTGGSVIAAGAQVGMATSASIDVSGAVGGGTALVGGGFQGRDPDIGNARRTLVEQGATIRANATERGDGGTVVVFAEQSTHFAGAIEARGGPQGGDGGAVEVSGKAALSFAGTVDTRAPAGKDGTLLLDPARITITAAPTGVPPALADASWLAAEDLGAQSLGAVDLANLLNTTSVRLQASESITVAANVSAAPAAPRMLTLEAPIVTIQGTISSSAAPVTVDIAARTVVAPPLERGEQQVQAGLARAGSPNSDVARLRAEIEAEIARDRERVTQAMQDSCAKPGAPLKQGCTVNPPRRFVFAG